MLVGRINKIGDRSWHHSIVYYMELFAPMRPVMFITNKSTVGTVCFHKCLRSMLCLALCPSSRPLHLPAGLSWWPGSKAQVQPGQFEPKTLPALHTASTMSFQNSVSSNKRKSVWKRASGSTKFLYSRITGSQTSM